MPRSSMRWPSLSTCSSTSKACYAASAPWSSCPTTPRIRGSSRTGRPRPDRRSAAHRPRTTTTAGAGAARAAHRVVAALIAQRRKVFMNPQQRQPIPARLLLVGLQLALKLIHPRPKLRRRLDLALVAGRGLIAPNNLAHRVLRNPQHECRTAAAPCATKLSLKGLLLRAMALKRSDHLHGELSVVRWSGTTAISSPGHSTAAPLTAPLGLSAARDAPVGDGGSRASRCRTGASSPESRQVVC